MAEPTEAQHHRLIAGPDAPLERIDRWLSAQLQDLTRSRIKALIEAGCLTSETRTIDQASERVKPGAAYVLTVPAVVPARLEAQALALEIVHEDEALIVIDKPAGLVVHPAPGNPDRTLVNALIAHCGESLKGIGGERRPGIVHRIDKDTSGLIVAAKSEAAHRCLVEQFAARSIERSYLAVVWGVPRPAAGAIEGNVGRSPRNRKKMAVLARGGRSARTHYQVIRVLAGGAASLVRCKLETGRTHQIRVHLSHQGHGLIGDALYGRATADRRNRLPSHARAATGAFGRQALHAESLGFQHPVTGKTLQFQSPLPIDMDALLTSLESL